jgi:hypothetical protein
MEANEPLVAGIPLVLGVRKGFPNFNEFEMQTQIQVCRKLEFLKHDANDPLPYQTNQMYLVAISNVFGVEAWNPYSNFYPRDLQLTVAVDMTEGITDEFGEPVPVYDAGAGSTSPSNRVVRFTAPPYLTIASNSWSGADPSHPQYVRYSFQTPFLPSNPGSFFFFQTNCSYSQAQRQFVVPYQSNFESGTGFPVPHWWISFKTRFRFCLVDAEANRIVDYVSLVSSGSPADLTTALMTGGHCGTSQQYVQDASIGSMWCTNRFGTTIDDTNTAPYGILNQIGVSLGTNNTHLDWGSFGLQYPQFDVQGAINFFRTNLLRWPSISGSSVPLYLTNHFYAPFAPIRNLYFYTSWSANDPLVHYTADDLHSGSVSRTNLFVLDVPNLAATTIKNIGSVNVRYEPWGGYGAGYGPSPTLYALNVKDPLVHSASDWDFPLGQGLDSSWVGRVHRGTPWQSIYLKSPAVDANTWAQWLGDPDSNDAQLRHPTNDWRLASLLVSLFNTSDPRQLVSPNRAGPLARASALDGILVLTNTLTDDVINGNPLGVIPQFDMLSIQSNSPQASLIATAIGSTRSTLSDGLFHQIGDILATPELSIASPYLNTSLVQQEFAITDEAYEAIPSQLLSRLWPDSLGTVLQTSPLLQIQFTGVDGYAYAVQTSANLTIWSTVATNYPNNGAFVFVDSSGPSGSRRFYRSVLLP